MVDLNIGKAGKTVQFPEEPQDDSKRSVMGRVFEILDCFACGEPEQTVASVCKQTGLPPATVHRMLANMLEWGAVERTARGRYQLGFRLWRLGWGVPETRAMRDIARPHLVDLHAATGEMAVLASRDGDELILADLIAGQSAAAACRPSRRMPLMSAAPGLVLLAFSPNDQLNRSLPRLTRAIGSSPSDDFRIRQLLGEVRRTSVAVTHAPPGGNTPSFVAAPIYDAEGMVRWSIGLAVPESRLTVAPLLGLVARAARAVSRELRGQNREPAGAMLAAVSATASTTGPGAPWLRAASA
jgi:DNA-binding IclR family transcriptional regulator